MIEDTIRKVAPKPVAAGTSLRTTHQPPRRGTLIFAWLVESIAIAMGLALAVFAGIEGSDSGGIAIAIGILPFIALSVIEMTKIPLVSLAFRVQSIFWRILAMVALLIVTVATFENFLFGFERGFNERIRAVDVAEQALQGHKGGRDIAEARISQLTAQQNDISNRLSTLREEVSAIREQAQQDIGDARAANEAAGLRAQIENVERELTAYNQRALDDINRERIRCRNNPQSRCNVGNMTAQADRHRATLTSRIELLRQQEREQNATAGSDVANARSRRDNDLAGKDRERDRLQQDLDAVRARLADAHRDVLQNGDAITRATQHRDELIDKSQLHRLSMVMFGSHARGPLEETKRLFVVSLAAIVALIGSMIAGLHFAAERAEQPRKQPLVNAVRGYLARRRGRIPIRTYLNGGKNRHGMMRNLRGLLARLRRSRRPILERVVEREVMVDRIKPVFLPNPYTEEELARARHEIAREAA